MYPVELKGKIIEEKQIGDRGSKGYMYWAVSIRKDGYAGVYEESGGGSSLYYTRLEDFPDFTCQICGKPARTKYYEPTKSRLERDHLCFSCNFWVEALIPFLTGQVSDRVAIIDGSKYYIGPKTNESSSFRGFGGQKFIIRFFDGREEETRNLWHNGDIPIMFRPFIKDNAEFVSVG